MTDFIILLRNIVLAALLAWLGMEFAPKQPDPKPDDNRESSLTVLARA
ncbi:hypothetical protein [Hyphomonas sp.]